MLVNIALFSSAFISVYPPTSAVKKRCAIFDSIWLCGKIKLEFSQLKEIFEMIATTSSLAEQRTLLENISWSDL